MHDMSHMQHNHPKPERPLVPRLPALICKVTNTIGIDAAFKTLLEGGDTLDAALHVLKAQEDDPDDHLAGLGGLPNERGEVQLDACCLHGPSRRSAAVSGVSGIRNVSLLARTLLQSTGDCLLAGSDAQAFALAHSFVKEDLLTNYTRLNYLLWKQLRTDASLLQTGRYDPSWPEADRKAHFLPASEKDLDLLVRKLEPAAVKIGLPAVASWRAVYDSIAPASEPVSICCIDRKGQMSAASTSAGRPWRMAGVGSDLAAIGAGCFVDPDVGSAASSGSAEANLKIAGAHTIVENMRMGMSPEEAGMDALRRIARWYGNDMSALRFVEMTYYILRQDGAYGSVSLWSGDKTGHVRQFTIMDGEYLRRTEDCAALFPCSSMNGCAQATA